MNGFVTLGMFDFQRAAGVEVNLCLGSDDRLCRAFNGAVSYMVLETGEAAWVVRDPGVPTASGSWIAAQTRRWRRYRQ
jgi:hypothetical protein